MPRPKGMGRESYADVFYAWAVFLGVLAGGLVAFVQLAGAQEVNHAAKQNYERGKSYHRICELTEADNIEIINRLSPDATITRFKGGQAKLYIYLLRTGNTLDGNRGKLSYPYMTFRGMGKRGFAGYAIAPTDADTVYIIARKNRTSVHPFFVVDGCVARIILQIPIPIHTAIVQHMKAQAI